MNAAVFLLCHIERQVEGMKFSESILQCSCDIRKLFAAKLAILKIKQLQEVFMLVKCGNHGGCEALTGERDPLKFELCEVRHWDEYVLE